MNRLNSVDTDVDLDEDLQFTDTKFYGHGQCKSLKAQPGLPTIKLEQIKILGRKRYKSHKEIVVDFSIKKHQGGSAQHIFNRQFFA